MRVYDLIAKKRDKGSFNQEEIHFFIQKVISGEIPDYQSSALLMAIFLNGMSPKETTVLLKEMVESGKVLDLSSIPGMKVDKHSTGGVGDGISLVLAPLVAACGVPVPMMAGRALGHTGGTLDKLESIPGFRTALNSEAFISQLSKIGMVIAGQTESLAPADDKLYALRDVTATVESIPLISASILSKKIAEGCDALVLDVKTGAGAFTQEKKEAIKLASTMVELGKRCRKKMVALVTAMDQPLGAAIGNALEIEQAIEILRGKEWKNVADFIELTDILGGWMLFFGGAAKNSIEGKNKIAEIRKTGRGLEKFKEFVMLQNGDPAVCERPKEVLPQAKFAKEILSPWKGTLFSMNARSVGVAALLLGAGRQTLESAIDPSSGILLRKKVGDTLERGESMAQFFYSSEANLDRAEKTFLAGVRIGKNRPKLKPLVHTIIR